MVQLFGRITKDAQVTETKSGKKVVNFSIALNDSYKPKDGEVKKFVTYVNCAYWFNSSSAAVLEKGKIIEVNGRLAIRAFSNMQGEAVGSLNFHVNNFKLFGKSSAEKNTTNGHVKTQRHHSEQTPDDLPF